MGYYKSYDDMEEKKKKEAEIQRQAKAPIGKAAPAAPSPAQYVQNKATAAKNMIKPDEIKDDSIFADGVSGSFYGDPKDTFESIQPKEKKDWLSKFKKYMKNTLEADQFNINDIQKNPEKYGKGDRFTAQTLNKVANAGTDNILTALYNKGAKSTGLPEIPKIEDIVSTTDEQYNTGKLGNFASDVLGAVGDPLTYVSAGVGGLARGAATKGVANSGKLAKFLAPAAADAAAQAGVSTIGNVAKKGLNGEEINGTDVAIEAGTNFLAGLGMEGVGKAAGKVKQTEWVKKFLASSGKKGKSIPLTDNMRVGNVGQVETPATKTVGKTDTTPVKPVESVNRSTQAYYKGEPIELGSKAGKIGNLEYYNVVGKDFTVPVSDISYVKTDAPKAPTTTPKEEIKAEAPVIENDKTELSELAQSLKSKWQAETPKAPKPTTSPYPNIHDSEINGGVSIDKMVPNILQMPSKNSPQEGRLKWIEDLFEGRVKANEGKPKLDPHVVDLKGTSDELQFSMEKSNKAKTVNKVDGDVKRFIYLALNEGQDVRNLTARAKHLFPNIPEQELFNDIIDIANKRMDSYKEGAPKFTIEPDAPAPKKDFFSHIQLDTPFKSQVMPGKSPIEYKGKGVSATEPRKTTPKEGKNTNDFINYLNKSKDVEIGDINNSDSALSKFVKHAENKMNKNMPNDAPTKTPVKEQPQPEVVTESSDKKWKNGNYITPEIESVLQNIENWKDSNWGNLGANFKDLYRNVESMIPDKAEAKAFIDKFVRPITEGNATINNEFNRVQNAIKQIGIKAGTPESAAAQKLIMNPNKLGEIKTQFPDSWESIQSLAELLKKEYTDVRDARNFARWDDPDTGSSPAKNYAPLFDANNRPIDSEFRKVLGQGDYNDALSAKIGMNNTYKNPAGRETRSFSSDKFPDAIMDAVGGFERYMPSALRNKHLGSSYKNLNELIEGINYKTSENPNIKLNSFLSNLTESRDLLAGKKAWVDDAWDTFTKIDKGNSKVAQYINKMPRNAFVNVLSSLSTALNQTVPGLFSLGTTNPVNSIKALGTALSKESKELMSKSAFLGSKNSINLDDIGKWNKAANLAGIGNRLTDDFTSKFVWLSKHNEALGKGLEGKEAINYADDWARRLIGNREYGTRSVASAQKNLSFIAPFQQDLVNYWQILFHDIPKNVEGGMGSKALFAAGILGASYAANQISTNLLTGRNVSVDPIGLVADTINDNNNENISSDQRKKNLRTNIAEQIPYAQAFINPERNMLVDSVNKTLSGDAFRDIPTLIQTNGKWLAPVPGFSQWLKSYKGANMNLDNGVYANDGKQLMYNSPDSDARQAQALLFGQNATPEAVKYWNEGTKPLSEDDTDAYEYQIGKGTAPSTAYNDIQTVNQADKVKSGLLEQINQVYPITKDPETGKEIKNDNWKANNRAKKQLDRLVPNSKKLDRMTPQERLKLMEDVRKAFKLGSSKE
jgi:hypothetical protein